MGFYPFNPNLATKQQTDAPTVTTSRQHATRYAPGLVVAADADGVLAAVTDTGAQQVITTGLASPAVPRNVTATAGGTAGDIKAVQVIVAGTNFAGAAITETLTAFTVNTAGIVTGNKAFATVTSVTIPAHDGNGATTAIGWGSKLGLPDKLAHNTVLLAALDNVREATAPTVVASATAVESNTVTLDSALNGTAVDVYYLA